MSNTYTNTTIKDNSIFKSVFGKMYDSYIGKNKQSNITYVSAALELINTKISNDPHDTIIERELERLSIYVELIRNSVENNSVENDS